SIQAESREEALAVFAAALATLPEPLRGVSQSRTLVVGSETSWIQLRSSDAPLILALNFDDPKGLSRATRLGHHVFVPLGRSDAASADVISVPPIARDQAKTILEATG